jgi:predicted nucleic acid-binding protein
MIYVLDTNVISDAMHNQTAVRTHIHANQAATIYLCAPVDYEIRRGLLRKRATAQLRLYENIVRPQFQWQPLTDDDWHQTAQLWANSVSKGRQLSDIDLLVAAIALRLDATIVTADDDFDALPVKRVNWREPPPKK